MTQFVGKFSQRTAPLLLRPLIHSVDENYETNVINLFSLQLSKDLDPLFLYGSRLVASGLPNYRRDQESQNVDFRGGVCDETR